MRNITTYEQVFVDGGTSPATEPMPEDGLQPAQPVTTVNELLTYWSGD